MTDEEPGASSRDRTDCTPDRGVDRDTTAGETAEGRNPDTDPAEYLPDDVTLDEFETVVDAATTVLDVQRVLRLPRWQVKRLLYRTDRWDEIETPAKRVEDLREENYNSDR